MIQIQSNLIVLDSSSVKKAQCIGLKKTKSKRFAKIGETLLVSLKERHSQNQKGQSTFQKGEKHQAVLIKTKKSVGRKDGSRLKFDNNAIILINSSKDQKYSSSFQKLRPCAFEIKANNHLKILSLKKIYI